MVTGHGKQRSDTFDAKLPSAIRRVCHEGLISGGGAILTKISLRTMAPFLFHLLPWHGCFGFCQRMVGDFASRTRTGMGTERQWHLYRYFGDPLMRRRTKGSFDETGYEVLKAALMTGIF